jgi:hypothetical protein
MGRHKLLTSILVAVIMCLPSLALSFTPDANTALYVAFNECAGSVLHDSSPFGITGTNYNSPTWLGSSQCYQGCCLQYDGINDYSVFLDQANLDQVGNFALAYWVKDLEPSSADAKRTVVGKPWALDASNPNYHAFFEASDAGEFTYRTGTTQRTAGLDHDVDSYYQCFVISKNATHVDVYKDGVFVASTALAGNANANNNPLYIAYHGSAGGFVETWSNIIIDNLVIENTTVNLTWAESFCDYTPLSCANKCTGWVAQDNCTLGQQLYKRTCLGNEGGCDLETYNATAYCGLEYNRSQGIYTQGYNKYTNVTSCETGEWIKSGEGVSSCSPQAIKIPIGCSNITVTEQITPIFQVPNNVGCEQGRFYMTTCTPSFNCQTGNYSCAQVNATQETVYTSYVAGEMATGASSLTVDNVCRCRWFLWDYGVTSHKIQESLKVECDLACSNGWVCASDDYKAYNNIDCTQGNLTYCANGCDYASGLCSGEDVGAGGSTKGNAVLWFLSPSPTGKIMMGLCGCVIIGALVLAITKSKEPILFIIGFGVGWVLFMFIGWIPAVLTIILIAFVALGAYFKLNK